MATSNETATGSFDMEAARRSYRERQHTRRQALQTRWAAAKNDADAIVTGIRERWHPERIVVWGSLLRPELFAEYSDIDIAVEGVIDMEQWSEMERWALQQTDLPLDLIPLDKIHPEHRTRILEKGVVVYEREISHG